MRTKHLSGSLRIPLVIMFIFSAFLNSTAQTCSSPPDCILNPGMTASTGGDLNPGSTTMNDWYYSHGTPTVAIGGGVSGTNSIWMWSYQSKGEGIYACYNFQQGFTYRLCFWVRNTGTLNLGNLNVKAANGLTQPPYSASTAIPAPSSQVIHNSWTYNTLWSQVVVDYTPNANYNQLWFYPFWSGISAQYGYRQYELEISNVHVFELPLGVGFAIPCDGDIVLPAHSSPCVTTDWYGPAGNYLGAGTVVIHHADASMNGDYTMVVTAGDCSYELIYQVMVEECNCDEFNASFTLNGGNPVNFTETSTGPGSSVSWFWEFGDGTTSNLQNPTHTYPGSGSYQVCLTVIRKVGNQTCCKRICKSVQVQGGGGDPDRMTGFINQGMDIPRAVQFHDVSLANGTIKDYHWDFGDGTSSGQANPAHVYPDAGTYNVCMKVKTSTYSKQGELLQESEKEYCNKVVVEGGALRQGDINIIPNPAQEQAFVTVKNMNNPKVILRTVSGITVSTGIMVEQGKYLLQLQKLSPGIYLVEVQSESGLRTMKLVKE